MQQPREFATGHRSGHGFSLVEVLVVVAIIGVLGAIGYPQYQNYVRESKRADAHAALTEMAARQERFYSNNTPPAYATTATQLGYGANPAASPDGYWSVAITGVTATGFTLNATPAGTHKDDDCNTISLNGQGVKSAKDKNNNAATNCW